jgi:hypothetical protein
MEKSLSKCLLRICRGGQYAGWPYGYMTRSGMGVVVYLYSGFRLGKLLYLVETLHHACDVHWIVIVPEEDSVVLETWFINFPRFMHQQFNCMYRLAINGAFESWTAGRYEDAVKDLAKRIVIERRRVN